MTAEGKEEVTRQYVSPTSCLLSCKMFLTILDTLFYYIFRYVYLRKLLYLERLKPIII
jgi:hypothetical protein